MRSRKIRNAIYVPLAAGEAFAFAVVYFWVDAVGILVGILVATIAALLFIREELTDRRQAFIHGYHAGYHSAHPALDCYGPSCAVLDVAEDGVERMQWQERG